MSLADRLRAGSSSPLNHRLMASAADDLAAGGVVATVFDGLGDVAPGAVPELRFVAAVHRLVLSRRAPRLALLYPSVGLNLRPDRIGLRVGGRVLGRAESARVLGRGGSALVLDADWTGLPPSTWGEAYRSRTGRGVTCSRWT